MSSLELHFPMDSPEKDYLESSNNFNTEFNKSDTDSKKTKSEIKKVNSDINKVSSDFNKTPPEYSRNHTEYSRNHTDYSRNHTDYSKSYTQHNQSNTESEYCLWEPDTGSDKTPKSGSLSSRLSPGSFNQSVVGSPDSGNQTGSRGVFRLSPDTRNRQRRESPPEPPAAASRKHTLTTPQEWSVPTSRSSPMFWPDTSKFGFRRRACTVSVPQQQQDAAAAGGRLVFAASQKSLSSKEKSVSTGANNEYLAPGAISCRRRGDFLKSDALLTLILAPFFTILFSIFL